MRQLSRGCGGRLEELASRWERERLAREQTGVVAGRAGTGPEQLAALWRLSEADQTAFFRAVRERVDDLIAAAEERRPEP
jgi:hypothetical protein